MSRPRQAVMEGEDAGPSYGAVNGVPPPPPPQATGGLMTEQMDAPSSSGTFPKQSASEHAVPIAPPTGPGASDVPSSSVGAVPKNAHHIQARHAQQTTAAAAPQPQQQRPSLPLTTTQASPTQPLPPATPTMGDRLPQPLQHAVQQLSQQRSAVIQAVQTRAQRALQGRRSDEVVNEGNILSPPRALLGPRR